MVKNLKIHIHKSGRKEPEEKVTIPLSVFQVGEKLLPRKVKELLQREEIDLTGLTELAGMQKPNGELITIEKSTEKIVILLDSV
ncbi:MAG: hypothetical protein GY795_19700 [Desulfobacterales bacterium]|nr:hypothetical protein [Desulfobacterales bacterium]